MTDNRISVQYVYSTEEYQFECALTGLIDNGCRASSGTEAAEWRIRIEGIRAHVEDQATVVERIRAAGGGMVEVWARDMPIKLRVGIGNELVPDEMAYLQLSVSNLYFDPDFSNERGPTAEEYLSWFLHLTTLVYRRTDPVYGYGSIPPTRNRQGYLPDPSRVSAGEPEQLYWLNYLNAEMVEHIGRETLIAAPVHRRERLPDDGEMLVVTEYPIGFGSISDQSSRVAEHLGVPIV